jgi:hypothetical protein
VALASACEDNDGLVQKVALLEGEHAKAHRAWEVAEDNFHSLSNGSASCARRLVVSEKEHREQFKELSRLRAWHSELCLAIVGPPWVRNHLLEGIVANP